MTPLRIGSLVGATILTTTAVLATIDRWHGLAPALRVAAVGAWIIFVVISRTDRILGAITDLRSDVNTYGDLRHSDGVIDGMDQTTPARPLPRPHAIRRIN